MKCILCRHIKVVDLFPLGIKGSDFLAAMQDMKISDRMRHQGSPKSDGGVTDDTTKQYAHLAFCEGVDRDDHGNGAETAIEISSH